VKNKRRAAHSQPLGLIGTMEETPDSIIRRELGSGERLLWCGRPRQGVAFRRADFLMVPFSLIWGGFAFFWEYSVLSMGNAPIFFALWGVPFVLVGAYIIAGRFIVDAKQRERTVYGVTSERIVIVSGLLSRQIKSLNIRSLSDVSLDQSVDGTGTITFGAPHALSSWVSGTAWPGMPQTPAFEFVAQARSVYDTIRKAQAGAG